MASESCPHQNRINALPASLLVHNPSGDQLKAIQSLEPDNWNWNLPQPTQNTVEIGTDTIKSLIADESRLLALYDDSYEELYDVAL